MYGIGCEHCCAIPPDAPGPECMCECHNGEEETWSGLQDAIPQEIWQRYVVEVGRSLPEGLADKLANSVMAVLPRYGEQER